MKNAFEFYETPQAFTHFLLRTVAIGLHGQSLCEPCVGSGAIPRALTYPVDWVTNDIDVRWPAGVHGDAALDATWRQMVDVRPIDWTVTNPPFSRALEIAELAIKYSRVGVAMHLRASFHEVLKCGPRRTWLSEHPPTGLLWLPRFAYQRSQTSGRWATDSVCACWVIWLKAPAPQFIRYAGEPVLRALREEQPSFRARMDTYAMEAGTLREGAPS